MLIKRTVLSLILLTLTVQAESQRREPSLFLEYERELKKVNDSAKNDVNPFEKNNTPLAISKPTPPTAPVVKSVASTETVLKNTTFNHDSIGKDANPYLMISKPSPIAASTICPDNTNSDETPKSTPQKIAGNFKTIKDKVLARAKEFLGTPYAFGGKNGDRTDCSGFTQQVYQQFGVNLPHSAAEQAQLGESVDYKDLQVGDLLFYRTYKSDPSHVAIYAGDGQIIHASFSGHKVQYDSIDKGYYKNHFLYAKRLALNTPQYDE
ncbi:MAG: NlpC/P60 family protein [Sulfuricurvum sp.]|uniref:C40 family peptidase n=1 Tax=Sulfuricurvum sp. TaxID=2025608 RepID=UPI002636C7EC|nr:C40 family peptidase [Sulfuricurvum sp.]MDD5118098.1 NlpC/P60 family protein [Sulfuricurvum sp.]